MENNPSSVVFDNITITDIVKFRFGDQLKEQRRFELRFKQQQFGAAFTYGLDDSSKYTGKPIAIKFSDAGGKEKIYNGKATNVEFSQSPGYQAEVIISGFVDWASNNQLKFNLLLAGFVLMPLIFVGLFFCYVNYLDNNLVKKEATINEFHFANGRGSRHYTFKTKEYQASFKRRYSDLFKTIASERMGDIFGNNTDSDRTPHQVTFYINKEDATKLGNPNTSVNFLYLQAASKSNITDGYRMDLIAYQINEGIAINVLVLFLLLAVLCCGGAMYLYSMKGLKDNPKNVIIYRVGLAAGMALNIAVGFII